MLMYMYNIFIWDMKQTYVWKWLILDENGTTYFWRHMSKNFERYLMILQRCLVTPQKFRMKFNGILLSDTKHCQINDC